MKRLLEVCVDDPAGIAEAVAGGADRIELCSALGVGGLTPSAGLIHAAADCGLPVMAMIRPRAGGFDWSPAEVEAMEAEIAAVRAAGLAGVVIGATRDGVLDIETLERLVRAAGPLLITLHRCVDLLADPLAAVDAAAGMGIGRILSSGGAQNVSSGLERLAAMQRHAAGRLVVMPGGGVSTATLPRILAELDPAEVHASGSQPMERDDVLAGFGFQMPGARQTDAATVAQIKALLDA